MLRIKELVRIATLERHFQHGLVATVEIIDLDGHWSVCVQYNERADEPRKRFLTSQRLPGPKCFASLSSAWKVLSAHGVLSATVRQATPAEVAALSARSP